MKNLTALDMSRLVWGLDGGRRVMAVFRAAFDSSQDKPQGVTTVSGYIADVDQWQSIERPWNNALALAGLPSFHLTEIKRRFNDWVSVVKPFAEVIGAAQLRSITAYLKDSDWAQLERDSAYRSLCPSREFACLYMLFGALSQEVALDLDNEPITVVFDNDWGGRRSAIIKIHDAWCADVNHPGFNIFVKGGVPWDSIPLQAADLAAGLSRIDPLFRSRLDDEEEFGGLTDISSLASRALGNGRCSG